MRDTPIGSSGTESPDWAFLEELVVEQKQMLGRLQDILGRALACALHVKLA